jgi:hypothetical protein
MRSGPLRLDDFPPAPGRKAIQPTPQIGDFMTEDRAFMTECQREFKPREFKPAAWTSAPRTGRRISRFDGRD